MDNVLASSFASTGTSPHSSSSRIPENFAAERARTWSSSGSSETDNVSSSTMPQVQHQHGESMRGSEQPKRRTAKACESCRLRRVKCSGTTPCKACTDAGSAESCEVRVKARPNRPITARHYRKSLIPQSSRPVLQAFSGPSISSMPLPRSSTSPHDQPFRNPSIAFSPLLELSNASSMQDTRRPSEFTRITPIRQIELALGSWCTLHDLPLDGMLFQDETRLSALHGSPLPPMSEIEAFEDELMRQLIITDDLEQASSLDRLQIVTLYNRYRIFPSALTADQKALVYASLCLAKHAGMKSYSATGISALAPQAREDVTYFRMACECLAEWSFPSVHALWALVCLVPYSQGHGGLAENRNLLRMMAWQVRELGLHRTDMGKLYLSGEMNLFPLFRYMDTFLAGLDDLQPFFTLRESDVDLSASDQLLAPFQQIASAHAARFHDDYNDPQIDTTSDSYTFLAESRWIPSLAQLQSGTTGGSEAKKRWSEIRYSWLHILLYFPRTLLDELRSNHAWATISYSTAQVIQIHYQLAQNGHLNPSWPQLRRFAICGQLLVLCCSHHLYQPSQSTDLFQQLFYLLDAHAHTWAGATDLLAGFQTAAVKLGVAVNAPALIKPVPLVPDNTSVHQTDSLNAAFPFDPTLLFGLDFQAELA